MVTRWLVLFACACEAKPAAVSRDAAIAAVAPSPSPPPPSPSPSFAPPKDPSWDRADFDGDRIPDPITSTFSGGAHCCSQYAVELSASHRRIAIPFEIDHGDHSVRIEIGSDGVASMVMPIATYGASRDPIPLEWVRAYKLHSHVVRVSLRGGALRVDNVAWTCAAALDALKRVDFAGWDGLPDCGGPELADLVDSERGVDRELGSAHVDAWTRRALLVDPDGPPELVLAFGSDERAIVRIDLDVERPAQGAIDAFGPPEARLPYALWGFTQPSGQWVWPSRGIAVYVDPRGETIHHVGVFAPTDLAAYRRALAWP